MTRTVVVLPGEGIGIEVVDAACDVLVGAGLPLKILTPPQVEGATPTVAGSVPDQTKQLAREADGVLFGAAGPAPPPASGWPPRGMRALAGARAVRFHPGLRPPV